MVLLHTYTYSLLLVLSAPLQSTKVVTHQCLCCTLQCILSGKHSLNQVSHSSRSHSLHLFCDASLPPSFFFLYKNSTGPLNWELGFYLDRTSFLWQSQYEEVCSKKLGQFCTTGHHALHQSPPGTQDCCSGMFWCWVRTEDHLHLETIRYQCHNLSIGNLLYTKYSNYVLEKATLAYILLSDKSDEKYGSLV